MFIWIKARLQMRLPDFRFEGVGEVLGFAEME